MTNDELRAEVFRLTAENGLQKGELQVVRDARDELARQLSAYEVRRRIEGVGLYGKVPGEGTVLI